LESNAWAAGSTTARYRAHPASAVAASSTGPSSSSWRAIVGIRNFGNFALPSMDTRAIWSRTPGFAKRSRTEPMYCSLGWPGISTSVGMASRWSRSSRKVRMAGTAIASWTNVTPDSAERYAMDECPALSRRNL
jgi:hypothetical protein